MKYLENLICVASDGSVSFVPVTFFDEVPHELTADNILPRVDVYEKKQIFVFSHSEEEINQITEQIIYRNCPCKTISKRKYGSIIEFEINI